MPSRRFDASLKTFGSTQRVPPTPYVAGRSCDAVEGTAALPELPTVQRFTEGAVNIVPSNTALVAFNVLSANVVDVPRLQHRDDERAVRSVLMLPATRVHGFARRVQTRVNRSGPWSKARHVASTKSNAGRHSRRARRRVE